MARIAWTPELDAELIGSWASGMSWKDIAQKFNSTEYAVKARHKKIKQLAKTVKPAPIEPIHTPEPEPELEPEPTVAQTKSLDLAGLLVAIYNLAISAGFTPDHVVLDRNNGVLTCDKLPATMPTAAA